MIFDVIAERARVAATHSVIIIKDDFSIDKFFHLLWVKFKFCIHGIKNYSTHGVGFPFKILVCKGRFGWATLVIKYIDRGGYIGTL